MKPAASERGGTLSALSLSLSSWSLCSGRVPKKLLKAVLTEMGQQQLAVIETFFHLACQNNGSRSLHFFK